MKIIIIGTAYPLRGAMAQLNAILYNYLSKNHEVKVYSFKRQYPKIFFPGKTQFETGKPAVEIPANNNLNLIDSINPINWLIVALKIRKEKPDLLIFRYWIPFFAPVFFSISFFTKIFTKTKTLFICDNVIPHERRIGDKLLTKIVFSTVDFFIVQSETVLNDLIHFNKSNKPVLKTPHPLYNIFGEKVTKENAKEFIEKNYKIKIQTKRIILFFGYIRKYKGLEYLIKAMSEIPDAYDITLLIVGEFYENEKECKELIAKNNLNDRIKLVDDFIPDEHVKYFICSTDVVVLPYIEATQSGIVQICYFYDKPCIATNVGGLSEMLNNGKTGLITKKGNHIELANSIMNFFNNDLEEFFITNIKTEKERYSWDEFTKKLLKLTNIKNTK